MFGFANFYKQEYRVTIFILVEKKKKHSINYFTIPVFKTIIALLIF